MLFRTAPGAGTAGGTTLFREAVEAEKREQGQLVPPSEPVGDGHGQRHVVLDRGTKVMRDCQRPGQLESGSAAERSGQD